MMMKKYRKFLLSVALIVIVIAVLIPIIFSEDKNVKYDNYRSIDSLITEKYSTSDIEKMREDFEHNNFDYSALKSHYNVQCLRKTYQGYYAVFLQNDGKRVFAFMDKKMKLYKILIIEDIKEREDYNFLEPGKTTESEILKYDENTVLLPVSSVTSTAHIIQEGLVIITYDRFDTNTGTLLDDPVVKSIIFFDNDDFPLKNDEMINLNVPYILGIDKK